MKLLNNETVGIFVPCCIDQFRPETANNAISLLNSMGINCFYPAETTCCGKELYHQGDRDTAKALGEKMIELFGDCDYIVSCSSACVVYMQRHFSRLFHNTTLHNNYRQFVDRCFDISDFLINVLHVDDPNSEYQMPKTSYDHKVTFMDHCTTLRDYHCLAHPEQPGLRDEPRRLLRLVDGIKLVEMQQQDVCCGFGSSFASQFTPISDSLTKRKVDNALSAGAECIVSTEMTCLLNLQSYIDKNNISLECIHIVDLLANGN